MHHQWDRISSSAIWPLQNARTSLWKCESNGSSNELCTLQLNPCLILSSCIETVLIQRMQIDWSRFHRWRFQQVHFSRMRLFWFCVLQHEFGTSGFQNFHPLLHSSWKQQNQKSAFLTLGYPWVIGTLWDCDWVGANGNSHFWYSKIFYAECTWEDWNLLRGFYNTYMHKT